MSDLVQEPYHQKLSQNRFKYHSEKMHLNSKSEGLRSQKASGFTNALKMTKQSIRQSQNSSETVQQLKQVRSDSQSRGNPNGAGLQMSTLNNIASENSSINQFGFTSIANQKNANKTYSAIKVINRKNKNKVENPKKNLFLIKINKTLESLIVTGLKLEFLQKIKNIVWGKKNGN